MVKFNSKITIPLVVLICILIFGGLCTKLTLEQFKNEKNNQQYVDNDKSNIKFPENDIIAVQRANLQSASDIGIGTGTYHSIYLRDKVIHQVFASLPNPQGGFSVHTETQPTFYKAWLVKKKSGSTIPLGKLVRIPDGVYKLKVETKNTDIFNNYNMFIITLEEQENAITPGKIMLKGGLRSTNNVFCET